ncbi:hypothetical protein KSP40_PGU015915 [Platanthera guangdongensis]|uniref:Protein downstream neighbor of Son n=1 Tax=Platanthera guangdongensis TaxID=2320717 RepID=A0ABR2MEM8_9ASPA
MPNPQLKIPSDLINPRVAENFKLENMTTLSCGKIDASTKLECSDSSNKATEDQGFRTIEKCSQSALRNVVEIHLGNEQPLDSTKVDMEKALKGLVALHKSSVQSSFIEASGKNYDLPSTSTRKVFPEFHMSGQKAPLDFTLKTTLRLISSSSVKWCQRLNATPSAFGIDSHTYKYSFSMDQRSSCTSGFSTTSEIMYSKSLHSWAFPQSSLPSSIITAMAMSATKGETDFLLRRQQDWEDSFRNLYFMLRKSICRMFYVFTSQFVVLFICNKLFGKRKSCSAYISQSTRGLRSMLNDLDVCFSMPLCRVEVEHATEADLAELSEIQHRNLGQAYHQDSVSGIDNSSESLLAFTGNNNVHGLYDFLLNYRSFHKSSSHTDVPALYAPCPFPNASLCIPEVKCKEIKRADAVIHSSSGSDADENAAAAALSLSAGSTCYSIEVKDAVLPPWVICRLCAAMSADGRAFESLFTTEPLSNGLNVALEPLCRKTDEVGNSDASLPASGDALHLPEAALDPRLQYACLKRLRYSCEGSYTAYVTEI